MERELLLKMALIVCPGVHSSALSDCFMEVLQAELLARSRYHRDELCSVLATEICAPFDGLAVGAYVQNIVPLLEPLLLVGFSAGVVGAIAAANLWQSQGGTVRGVIAVDGWGVPHVGAFPFHRVSHDYFTHWSSALLGSGQAGFYADPSVDHLALWQSPDLAVGYETPVTGTLLRPVARTAIAFITDCLLGYGCGSKLKMIGL